MALGADRRIGSRIAGYRVERLLGRGGTSVVYLAQDLRLKRNVALKLLSSELSEDGRFRARFLRESELAASLDHPNVIPIYEAGESEGRLHIAMRYVEGSDLRELLAASGPLEPSLAIALLGQAADALDAAHERGLVHRDVKPGNILLDTRQHVYLTDFGLTRQAASESGLTETEHFVGTADYVAPEQIERQAVDGRADQYSLACVLYHCLCGEAPYHGDSLLGTLWGHLGGEPTPISKRRPELPAGIDAVLAKGMAKEPGARYESCRELIDGAAAALGVRDEAVPAGRRGRRRWTAVAGLLLAAAVAAVVAAVLLSSGGDRRAEPAPLRIEETSLVRIDPKTAEPVAAVDTGLPVYTDVALALGGGAVWVADTTTSTVSRIDRRTNALTRTVAIRGAPADIAVGQDAVWAVSTQQATGILTEIDPASGVIRHTYELPYADPVAIAAHGGEIWVAANDLDGRAVFRAVPRSGTIRIGPAVPFGNTTSLVDVAVGDGVIWATTATRLTSAEGALTRIDPTTNSVVATIPLARPGGIALAQGAVWTVAGGGVVRIDAVTHDVAPPIRVGPQYVYGLAAGADGVWVTTGDFPGRVLRIDPATNRVTARITMKKGSVWAVVAGDDSVWAA